MAKQIVKAHLYMWVGDNGQKGDFTVTAYPLFGENWVPVNTEQAKDGSIRSMTTEMEVEVPDTFLAEWRKEAVKNIEREEGKLRAEFTNRLYDLREFKEKLLAIAYEAPPAGEES